MNKEHFQLALAYKAMTVIKRFNHISQLLHFLLNQNNELTVFTPSLAYCYWDRRMETSDILGLVCDSNSIAIL